MYYASVGALALILHLIINHEIMQKGKDLPEHLKKYREFLLGVTVYYAADTLWGVFYESKMYTAAYIDTMIFFMSVVTSVLLWTRFVASYLDRKNKFVSVLYLSGWTVFMFEVMVLVINFANPIVFEFKKDGEYVAGPARYVALGIQFLVFAMASVYTMVVAAKSSGKERIHNKTVGLSGMVMMIFIVLQSYFPLLPLYSMGILVATCLMHVFVEEDERFDVNLELYAEKRKVEEAREEGETFSRIAEGLASNYDIIYYVNAEDNSFVGYTKQNIYGQLQVNTEGPDFFVNAKKTVDHAIHPQDVERVRGFLNRDHFISALETKRRLQAEYRMVIDGKPKYTRSTVIKTSDSAHFIVGVENIDEEVRKEREHLIALNTEKELARRDELTGIKNRAAYAELEEAVQEDIDSGTNIQPFAIIVSDLNDLKLINDTKGHKEGDEYIKRASALLCDIFSHSPVFRVGGDEFVVFLKGYDYISKDKLVDMLFKRVSENKKRGNGPVIATGIAQFDPDTDKRVSDVFERADKEMYANKKMLKGESA